MNGETHELESAHKVTIAHDDAGRATITVQGGGSVAIAHLTPAEADRVADTVYAMADHLDPSGTRPAIRDTSHLVSPLEVELRAALADARALLQEAVAELEAAKGEASGGGDVTLGVA